MRLKTECSVRNKNDGPSSHTGMTTDTFARPTEVGHDAGLAKLYGNGRSRGVWSDRLRFIPPKRERCALSASPVSSFWLTSGFHSLTPPMLRNQPMDRLTLPKARGDPH